MKRIFLIVILLTAGINIHAGELEFGWNLYNESGKINDMEFMPDNNYFILATDVDIQIRNSETGEEVKKYDFGASEIEFSPDSTILFLLKHFKDSTVQIRKYTVKDMSLVDEIIIPKDTDTEGLDIFASYLQLKSMVVDPIRKNIYVIRRRRGYLSGGKPLFRTKIIVYDYDTMSEKKELIVNTLEFEEYYEYLDVSKDGRYLGSISSGKSKIKVWDLNSFEMITDYDICNSESGQDAWGTATCIKFSKQNTDNIYFSGEFEHWRDDNTHYGIFNYNIQECNVIDSTFGVGEKMIGYGYFDFFNNEKRIVKTGSGFIKILDIVKGKIEQSFNMQSIDYRMRWDKKVLYSSVFNLFIGSSNEYYSSATFYENNVLENLDKYSMVIFPNPTTGIININEFCSNISKYEIYDIKGNLISSSNANPENLQNHTIDISNYQSGTYFIRFYCGKNIKVYKIIKE